MGKYLLLVVAVLAVLGALSYLSHLASRRSGAITDYTIHLPDYDASPHELFVHKHLIALGRPMDPDIVLPKYFKYRESLLVPVRTQGQCASCWAFATVDMLADRISAMTGGRVVEHLSPQDLLSCFRPEQFSCRVGGIPELAYMGVITNGVRREGDSPYKNIKGGPMVPCEIETAGILEYVWPSARRLQEYPDRVFGKEGTNRSLCKKSGGNEDIIRRNVRNMKIEIMTHGPVLAAMTVYSDLYNYDGTSIYRRGPNAKKRSGHAIEIFGWSEAGVNTTEKGFEGAYWLCRNSWSSVEEKRWPRKSPFPGWFYLAMGVNECGIEDRASALQPIVAPDVRDGPTIPLSKVAYLSYDAYVNDPERMHYMSWLASKKDADASGRASVK